MSFALPGLYEYESGKPNKTPSDVVGVRIPTKEFPNTPSNGWIEVLHYIDKTSIVLRFYDGNMLAREVVISGAHGKVLAEALK